MNYEQEQGMDDAIEKWLNERHKDRWKEYTSNRFLAAMLGIETRRRWLNDKKQDPMASAYFAGCLIFETALEHWCRAGGNGHHCAQSYVGFIEVFLADHEAAHQEAIGPK